MSLGVARAFFGSFSVSTPAFCSRIRARPLLLPSLGMAMVAPSGSSLSDLYLLEYPPKGSTCTPWTITRWVPLPLLKLSR
ncbi:hypothetical protein D9M71_850360 [compost metagenome]